jgi:hypothetical protein
MPPPAEAQRDPDALPDSTDASGPCPRCGRVSSFSIEATCPVTFRKDGSYTRTREGLHERIHTERVAVLECRGCRDRTVVIEEQLTGGVRGGRAGTITYRGMFWWPVPEATALGPDVPGNVAEAFSEAQRCLSVAAPNAAVAMLRTAISHIVDDKGSSAAKAKGSLKDKIHQVLADGTVPASLGQWVTHVRLYGNAGAHPDIFGDVSIEEAKDVARLTATLIEVLYVLPANIAKRQGQRSQRP